MLCSTFKGVLPSDLFERYDCEGGRHKLEFDLLMASEITERIVEQTDKAKNAKSSVEKRNQRRAARMSGKELGEVLSDAFGTVENTGE